MNSRPELKLDWCSHEAAKYAVEKWHYSRKMPVGKCAKVGVWEYQKYIGSVIFGTGAAPQAAMPYKLGRFEIAELVRVALCDSHQSQVSRIVKISITLLRKQSPGLKLLVSYADPGEGHHGGIYQAGGWIYVGASEPKWRANGQHNRAFGTSIKRARERFGPDVKIEWELPKHKYLMPLDAEMRRRIEPLRKPYPKRASEVKDDTAGDHSAEGGETPTRTLQLQR